MADISSNWSGRGWVDSGSEREKVGQAKVSGQFTLKWRLRIQKRYASCIRSSSNAGSEVLQALTFFGTREKLNRAGYGGQTEAINDAAVKIAREVCGRQGSRRRLSFTHTTF